MAIPWLAVLKSVPWKDVITNAPKVAEGAKKLWSAVSKPSGNPPATTDTTSSVATDSETIAALQARLAAMEIAIADLHNQMLGSSELIKALADQNAQLIKSVDSNRVRLAWLTGATVLFGVAVLGLAWMLLR